MITMILILRRITRKLPKPFNAGAVAGLVAILHVRAASLSSFEKCYTADDSEHCFQTNRDDQRTWKEAKKYCDGLDDGRYSLVAVSDAPVRDHLEDFYDLNDYVNAFFWTGITQTTSGQWVWTDANETHYTGEYGDGNIIHPSFITP